MSDTKDARLARFMHLLQAADEEVRLGIDLEAGQRKAAAQELLAAWEEYVRAVGDDLWSEFASWTRFCGGSVELFDPEVDLGTPEAVRNPPLLPEVEALVDSYGGDTLGAIGLLQALARAEDENTWPNESGEGEDEFERRHRMMAPGVPLAPGIRLYRWKGHDRARGLLRWREGEAVKFDGDAALWVDRLGFTWKKRGLLSRQDLGSARWGEVSQFATRNSILLMGFDPDSRLEFSSRDAADTRALAAVAEAGLGPRSADGRVVGAAEGWRSLGLIREASWRAWWRYSPRSKGLWLPRYLYAMDRAGQASGGEVVA